MPESAGTLFVNIEADSGGLSREIHDLGIAMSALGEKMSNAAKKVESDFDKMQRKLNKVGKGFEKVGKKMTTFVTLPILAMGVAAVKTAADIETQTQAFSTFLGSAEKGKKLFEELKKFSAETPLQLGDITKGAQTLLAFGSSAENVRNELQMLGDAAQGNAAKLDTLVRAYGKVQAKGKASLEELNMITEAGVPILDALSSRYGITNEELFKMVSSGKVGFEDLKGALTDLTSEGGQFNNMMLNISQTTSGKFSTAVDNVKLALASLGVILLPVVNKMIDGITRLAQWFTNLSEGTKKTLIVIAGFAASIGVVLLVVGKIILVVAALQKAFVALNITMNANVFSIIVIAIAAVITAIILLVKNFDYVKVKVKSFWAEFTYLALQAFTVVSVGVLKFVEYFLKAFELVNKPIFLMINQIIKSINAISGKNIPTLTAVFNKSTKALNNMSKQQIKNFQDAASEHEIATRKEIAAEKEKAKELEKIEDDKKPPKPPKPPKPDPALRKAAVEEYQKLIDSNEEAENTAVQNENARYSLQMNNVKNYLNQKAISEQEAQAYTEELEIEHQRKLMQIRQEAFNNALSIASQLTSQTSAIFDQYYTNRSITLDNDQKREEDAIKKSALTEEQKQIALDKIAAKYDKKRKKLQLEQAKQQKVMSIFNATIATAQAVTGALGNFPWSPANIALAAIMGSLGAAQIGLIASQPLPELATGGLTTGATQAIIGEAGQEAVIPLTNQSSLDAIASALAPALAARLAVYNQPITNNITQGTLGVPQTQNSSSDLDLRPVNIDSESMFDLLFRASKNNQLFISANAVVS